MNLPIEICAIIAEYYGLQITYIDETSPIFKPDLINNADNRHCTPLWYIRETFLELFVKKQWIAYTVLPNPATETTTFEEIQIYGKGLAYYQCPEEKTEYKDLGRFLKTNLQDMEVNYGTYC